MYAVAEKKSQIVLLLRSGMTVRGACEVACIHESSHYTWVREDSDYHHRCTMAMMVPLEEYLRRITADYERLKNDLKWGDEVDWRGDVH